jgi:hypothetical protein
MADNHGRVLDNHFHQWELFRAIFSSNSRQQRTCSRQSLPPMGIVRAFFPSNNRKPRTCSRQ